MAAFGLNNVHNFTGSIINKIVDRVPAATFSNEKFTKAIKWSGQHISSPENRLILGATALMSQPFIDLHNINVDEKTREQSAARSFAKIIAGTISGFWVRYLCIKAINSFTKDPKTVPSTSKYKSLFYPKNIAKVTAEGLQHHKQALGSFLALVVMLFTNFLIDAPFTKFLTNKFISYIDKNDAIKNKGGK